MFLNKESGGKIHKYEEELSFESNDSLFDNNRVSDYNISDRLVFL